MFDATWYATVQEDYLPSGLKTGGALHQRILDAQESGKYPELTKQIEATFTELQQEFGRWDRRAGRSKTDKRDWFETQAGNYAITQGLDRVVLTWASSELLGDPVSQLVGPASEMFRRQRQAYEFVLGDLLTDRLKASLDPVQAGENEERRRSVAELIQTRRKNLLQRKARPISPSGYAELDRLTGGLSGYILVSGNPATDAGAMALNLVYRAVFADPTAAAILVPIARSEEEVVDRLLGIGHDLPLAAIPDLTKPETTSAFDEAERSTVLGRMDLLERTGVEQTYGLQDWLQRIKTQARTLLKRTQAQRLLVVIDPLHEITFLPADRGSKGENPEIHFHTEAELDRLRVRIVQGLLQVLHGFNPAIIAVNKSTKVPTGRKMGLDDIYGGVDLIYPATTVLLLDRDDRGTTSDGVHHVLTVAKAENGVTGEVSLVYKPTTRSFTSKGSGSGAAGGNPFTAEARANGKRGGKR